VSGPAEGIHPQCNPSFATPNTELRIHTDLLSGNLADSLIRRFDFGGSNCWYPPSRHRCGCPTGDGRLGHSRHRAFGPTIAGATDDPRAGSSPWVIQDIRQCSAPRQLAFAFARRPSTRPPIRPKSPSTAQGYLDKNSLGVKASSLMRTKSMSPISCSRFVSIVPM